MAIKFLNSVNADSGVLYVDAANNRVGIHTTAPVTSLHIAGEDSIIRLGDPGTGAGGPHGIQFGYTATDGMSMYYRTTPEYLIWEDSMGQGGNGLMVLERAGNLGIGTTSPSDKLHVQEGDIRIDDPNNGTTRGLYIRHSGITGNVTSLVQDTSGTPRAALRSTERSLWLEAGSDGGALASDIRLYANQTLGLMVSSSGNVGIGTTSPGHLLEVRGTSDALSVGNDTNTQTYMRFAGSRTMFGYTGADAAIQGGSGKGIRFNVNDDSFNSGTAMYINSSGNVGIGTTSPKAKMHIGPTALVSGYTTTRTTLAVSDTTNGAELILRGQSPRIWFDATAAGSGEIYMDGTNLNILSGNPTSVGSSRLYINSSGNVGIGTTTPSADLHIGNNDPVIQIGTANTTTGNARLEFYSKNDGSANAYTLQFTKGTGVDRLDFIDGSGNARIVFKNGGYVGIGTTNPTAKLHISNTSGDANILLAGSSGQVLSIDQNSIRTTTASQIAIFTNSTTTNGLYINSSGNIGVGTTSPSEKLHVSGNVRIEGDLTVNGSYTQIDTDVNTTEQWNVTNDGTGPAVTINQTGAQDIMDVQDDGTSVFYIEDGGNVGIGTTDPAAKLEIADSNYVDLLNLNRSGTNSVAFRVGNLGSGDVALDVRLPSLSSRVGIRGAMSIGADYADGANTGISNGLVVQGNVGIGTPSPQEELEVKSASFSTVAVNTDRNTAGENIGSFAFYGHNNATTPENLLYSRVMGSMDSVTDGSESGDIYFQQINSGTIHETFRTNADGKLKLSQYGSNSFTGTAAYALAVDSSGNVIETSYIPSSSSTDFVAVTGDTMTGGLNIEVSASNTQLKLKRTTSATGEFNIYTNTDSLYFNNVANTSYPMVIDSNDRVGIGTTTPDAKLNVTDGGTQVTISNTYLAHLQSASNCGLAITAGASSNNYIAFGDTDDYDEGIINYNNSTRSFGFRTAGTGYDLTIDSSGNVGIGTTSPGAKLQVKTATDQNIAFNLISGGPLNGIQRISSYNDAITASVPLGIGASELYFLSGASSAERMRIDANGNVGIGITNPNEKLQVAGNINAYINGGIDAGLFASTSAGVTTIALRSNGITHFNGGNVGIGTTNPDSLLQIGESYTTTSGTNKKIIANIGGYYSTANGFQYQALGFTGTTFDESDISGQTGSETSKNFYIGLFSDVGYFNADRFSIYQGGAERLSIKQGGNVGIGTTDPGAKLEVNVASGDGILIKSADVATLKFKGGGSNNWGFATTNLASGDFGIYKSNVQGGDPISAGTPQLYIKSNGNVGIGTTSPVAALHVQSSSTKLFLSNTDYNNATSTGSGMILQTGASSGNTYGQIYSFKAGNTSYANLVVPGGNVGIGTSSPADKLHVEGNITLSDPSPEITLQTGATHYNWQLAAQENVNAAFEISVGSQDADASNDTWSPKMVVLQSGNVGIGTNNPTTLLELKSTTVTAGLCITAANNAYSDINLGDVDDVNIQRIRSEHSSNSLLIYTDNSERMRINSSGNVGIGTTSPDAKLDVEGGNIRITYNSGYNLELSDSGGAGTINANGDSAQLRFGTTTPLDSTATERMRIDANGNVGIGTTTFPTTGIGERELLVQGAIVSKPAGVDDYYSYLKSNWSDDGAFELGIQGADTNHKLITTSNYYYGTQLNFHTSDEKRMVIDTNGKVGIGTTAPIGGALVIDVSATSAIADVGAQATNTLAFNYNDAPAIIGKSTTNNTNGLYIVAAASDTNSNADFKLNVREDNNSDFSTLTTPAFDFSRWTTSLMTILRNGNVGIGTDSPSQKLEVNGSVKADSFIGGNDAGIYTFNDTVDASSSEDIFSVSCTNGAAAFRVTFVCSTSGMSVAKTYEVVKAFGADPVFFKVVDTGAYSGHDFDVSFTNSNSDTGVTCEITNNSTTINANIVTTVFLGGSPTTITVTAL